MRTYVGNPRTLAVIWIDRDVLSVKNGDGKPVAQRTFSGSLDPRLEWIRHSPTGFAWGYSGSGPSQLAFALLADALSFREKHDPALALRRAANPMLYQLFKEQVVARWNRDSEFQITSDEILEWIRKTEKSAP